MSQQKIHVVRLPKVQSLTELRRRLPLLDPLIRHYRWLMELQPWMGAPRGFDYESECIELEGLVNNEATFWRSGALHRWAPMIGEEYLSMWAIRPTVSAAVVGSTFARSGPGLDMHGLSELRLVFDEAGGWSAQTVNADLAWELSRDFAE